ncbi:MAG TPA: phosphatase domain-containing protein [Sunxiuqinia sp.]|nr:phosphatase domain-containing protein [Sunxiuqinia sp.]
MADETKTLQYLNRKNKGLFSKLKLQIKHRLGWLGGPQIIPYRGYGTADEVFVTGYLTENKGLAKPDENHSIWSNLLAMLKRYSSDEIPDAKIQLKFKNQILEVLSEETGLFRGVFKAENKEEAGDSGWHDYQVQLRGDWGAGEQELKETGEVLIPASGAEFGVISDVDDTIIVSHSTQMLRKLRLMLLRNSRTRKPFPGVDAFYHALFNGYGGVGANPFFYVSSSEWNLYDLLEDFCSYNKLPKGVFLLRELQSSIYKFWKSGGGDHEHKFRHIKKLFGVYPKMSFVLIGDNSQRDPGIYYRIAREYPGRVKAIYIRTIRKHKENDEAKELAQQLKSLGVPIVFAKDTVEAASHAVSEKLIRKETMEYIRRDAENDRKLF